MLEEIVASVRKVNQTIADISIASEEQSSGIEQVNQAITQMDEMTQQNAALVEQASAAGESMSEQAKAMKQLLSFFNLSGSSKLNGASRHPTHSRSRPSRSAVSQRSAQDDEEWQEF